MVVVLEGPAGYYYTFNPRPSAIKYFNLLIKFLVKGLYFYNLVESLIVLPVN